MHTGDVERVLGKGDVVRLEMMFLLQLSVLADTFVITPSVVSAGPTLGNDVLPEAFVPESSF